MSPAAGSFFFIPAFLIQFPFILKTNQRAVHIRGSKTPKPVKAELIEETDSLIQRKLSGGWGVDFFLIVFIGES